MDFHTADPSDVLGGRVADVYFLRTEEALKLRGVSRRVRAEFLIKGRTNPTDWSVLCGVEDVLEMIEELRLPVHARALPEGTLFHGGVPLLEIEGDYLAFGRFETAFLGLLCQATGVATRAAEVAGAAEGRPVICFGARRVHPILAPAVERYAYLGGMDGVAAILSAEKLGLEPSGTMPHALVLLLEDTVEAAKAFHEAVPPEVPRVVLVDTFRDEKFEAVRAARALGPALAGVRLDTPRSRRGDFLTLLREVRWELDLRGFRDVRIFVSGGVTARDIRELNPAADAYGVGSYVTSAPAADIAMDLVEVDGKPLAKRGKRSGAKSVWRCTTCGKLAVAPLGANGGACPCGGERRDALEPVIRDGRRIRPPSDPASTRARVLEEIRSGRAPVPRGVGEAR